MKVFECLSIAAAVTLLPWTFGAVVATIGVFEVMKIVASQPDTPAPIVQEPKEEVKEKEMPYV